MSFTTQNIDPSVPDLGNAPLPVEPYVCTDYFARERDRIFGRLWLNVGRTIEIPEPRDFVVKAVEVRNASIIITRGEDRVVRAFHNICPHRAAKVEWSARGRRSTFTCRYHAWTFDLEGRLRNVPAEANFIGMNKSDCGLTPVACEVWKDMIFINFDPRSRQSLREYLGEFAVSGDDYPFDQLDAGVTLTVPEVRCNWKILMDAFQELYHVNVLHRQSLKTIYGGNKNPYNDPLYFRTFGPHRSLSFGFNVDFPVGPMERMSQRFAVDLTSAANVERNRTESGSAPKRLGLNPSNAENFAFDINTIFPNTVWIVGTGAMNIHRFWPITAHTCRYESTVYSPRPTRASERFARDFRFGVYREAVMEDVRNTEMSQEALLSGGKQHIYLSQGEISIRHQLNAIDRYVREDVAHA